MKRSKSFVWLFGENIGATANNNSYYFWDHIVDRDDGICKYFILERSRENRTIVQRMDASHRRYVVWRNSLKHLLLYLSADMVFVTLSYRDVRPEKIFLKKLNFKTQMPVVYLQHGTLAIKQLGYSAHTYNNNLYRFVYYNPSIQNQLLTLNRMKEYQLLFGVFHPRHKELVRRERQFRETVVDQDRQIFWFLTWREYFGGNIETDMFIHIVKKVLHDKILKKYLESNSITLRVCMHTFFDKTIFDKVKSISQNSRIEIVYSTDIDLMDEIIHSELLITDYSSLGFDFTLLGRPVILFQPDIENYLSKRKLYCSIEELNEHNITRVNELVDLITSNERKMNNFFLSRLPNVIDLNSIERGLYIDRMYEYFSDNQRKRITFVGYNFYGVGGTVSATKALAEGLLEAGYMVQLMSLKKNRKLTNSPAALNFRTLYDERSKGRSERLKKWLFQSQRFYGDIKHDRNMQYLIPYTGYGLRRFLAQTKSAVVVSTRESLHAAVYKARSSWIKEKVYFFHCTASIFHSIFPGCMDQIRALPLKKAIFVTERSRQEYVSLLGYEQYEKNIVLGNTLESNKMVDRDSICAIKEKHRYSVVCLMRISQDRVDDIENLIKFGRFLKDTNCKQVIINVYGTGDYCNDFVNRICEEDLETIIVYRGLTKNPALIIRKHDALIDLSYQHSFGMTYVEGVLNGKPVLCLRNPGSMEVLGDIPWCFIDSYSELLDKILSVHELSAEELQDNYDCLMAKYSRRVVVEKFLEYVDL